MSAERRDGWQPVDWQPTPENPYQPRGEQVSLVGGPLDGRTAHVADARESLWIVQTAAGGFEAVSAMLAPDAPAGARVVGRYTVAPGSGTLRWHPAQA